jgi:DNA-binding response OmpR family regulator
MAPSWELEECGASVSQPRGREVRMASTVVVVEDDRDTREILCDLLRGEGYHAAPAEDGERAKELLLSLSEPPCAVLLDLGLPRVSGNALLCWMRSEERLRDVPVAVMTGWKGAETGISARDRLVSILHKPFPIEDVLRLLDEHCQAA